jgi:hypothetical protein
VSRAGVTVSYPSSWATMLRTVTATRYVTPLREGGSLPGLVEADDCGLYVVKFRAAGQGAKALVAEIIVGSLAHAAGLPTPEVVLVQIPDGFGSSEPDPEIHELVTGSAGINVGLDFLPSALDLTAAPDEIGPELAARIVVFDAFTTNVDRTPRNPNMLTWHGSPWLIDHGAALYQHHGTSDLRTRAADTFPMVRDHVLLAKAGNLHDAEDWLRKELTPETIEDTVDLIPDVLLGDDPDGARDMYAGYLVERLRHSHQWVQVAVAAQVEAVASDRSKEPPRGPRDV